MSVPTLVSVSPASGPASGGNIVVLTGYKFATPTLQINVPTLALAPTVAVSFNGIRSAAAQASADSAIRAVVPRYLGDAFAQSHAPVDVVVQNLDSAGAAIPGEISTLTGAYTYMRHASIPAEGGTQHYDPLAAVAVQLLDRLAREVLPRVAWSSDVDYGDYGVVQHIAHSEVPSIQVDLSFPLDSEYAGHDAGYEVDDAGDIYRGFRTHRIDARISCIGDGKVEALGLAQSIHDAFTLDPWIVLPTELAFADDAGRHAVDLATDISLLRNGADAGIKVAETRLRVRGIRCVPGVAVAHVKRATFAHLYTQKLHAGSPGRIQIMP